MFFHILSNIGLILFIQSPLWSEFDVKLCKEHFLATNKMLSREKHFAEIV